MAGVCRTCYYFQANAYPGSEKPHKCAFLDMPIGDDHANHMCPEHKDPAAVEKQDS